MSPSANGIDRYVLPHYVARVFQPFEERFQKWSAGLPKVEPPNHRRRFLLRQRGKGQSSSAHY